MSYRYETYMDWVKENYPPDKHWQSLMRTNISYIKFFGLGRENGGSEEGLQKAIEDLYQNFYEIALGVGYKDNAWEKAKYYADAQLNAYPNPSLKNAYYAGAEVR